MTKVQDVSNYWLQQHNMLVAAAAIFLCLKIFKFYIFSSSWKKTWGKDFSMFMLLLCQTDALWRTKYFHQTSQRITNIKHFKFGGIVLIFGDEPTNKANLREKEVDECIYAFAHCAWCAAPSMVTYARREKLIFVFFMFFGHTLKMRRNGLSVKIYQAAEIRWK